MDIIHNNILYHRIILHNSFTTPPEDLLQIRIASYEQNSVVKPHQHILNNSMSIDIPIEMWYVLEGRINATLYGDDEETLFCNDIFDADTLIITYRGHHSFIAIEKTKLLEVKNLPFTHFKTLYL